MWMSFYEVYQEALMYVMLVALFLLGLGVGGSVAYKWFKKHPERSAVDAVVRALFVVGMGLFATVTMAQKRAILQVKAEQAEERRLCGEILVGGIPSRRESPRSSGMHSVSRWQHGVYEEGEEIKFEGDWEFPYGTNHLSSVEVMAWGDVLPDGFSRDKVATLGRRVSFAREQASFTYGLTPSNSYVFIWTGTRDGRINGVPFEGRIELFRNGDVAVTTNGVTTVTPRELPFEHEGYGQDGEWVEANFTNVTEIAAAGGYAAWVDEQVGEGLTNGLYKLTVSLAEDPPEATQVSVGNVSVAITNAGDYVFLLEKGRRYDLSASSDYATNFVYSAVDDVAVSRRGNGLLRNRQRYGAMSGVWSSNYGELRLFAPFGFVAWDPSLEVSPRKWRPARASAVKTFTAVVTDVPWGAAPTYAWASADGNVCSCADATGQSATFTCHFPAADGNDVSLSLDVTLEFETLHAEYLYHIGEFDEAVDYEEEIEDFGELSPSPNLVVDASPSVVFFEAGTPNLDRSDVGCYYLATEPGTFELAISGDSVSVTDSGGATVASGYAWSVDGGVIGARHFSVGRPIKSTSTNGTAFAVSFTPATTGVSTMTDSASVTFVEWETRTVEMWPNDRHRKELGVGEKVDIEFNPAVAFSSVTNGDPSGNIVPNGNSRYRYTAPTNRCNDAIGFSSVQDGLCTMQFEIFEPTGSVVVNVSSNLENHLNIAGTFEVYVDLVLMPTNVSFRDTVEVAEIGSVSTNAVGYFANPALAGVLNHGQHGAGSWVKVVAGNSAGMDTFGCGALYPPFSDGSFTWPIPNQWRMFGDTGNGKLFCNEDQHFAITASGTTRVWKFGKKGERLLNSNIVTVTDEAIP